MSLNSELKMEPIMSGLQDHPTPRLGDAQCNERLPRTVLLQERLLAAVEG